jgi:enoyl-CoA hydratase
MTDLQFLRCHTDGAVATVELSRPPVNAVNVATYREIRRVFSHPELLGRQVRVVVLAGSGKHFCAGNDLEEFESMNSDSARQHMFEAREAFDAVYSCPVPVVGAVHGVALGTGLVLAACCDFVVAEQDARFGLPELSVGVAGGVTHLARLVPQNIARMMFFTSEPVLASLLFDRGGICKIVPSGGAMAAARELAARVAAHSPAALRHAKRVLNDVEFVDLRRGYEMEQKVTAMLSDHPDSKEALRAHRERRAPVYSEWGD